jgi:hypothetical protein
MSKRDSTRCPCSAYVPAMRPNHEPRERRLREARQAPPGWLWIARCDACRHVAGLPVEALIRRHGELRTWSMPAEVSGARHVGTGAPRPRWCACASRGACGSCSRCSVRRYGLINSLRSRYWSPCRRPAGRPREPRGLPSRKGSPSGAKCLWVGMAIVPFPTIALFHAGRP